MTDTTSGDSQAKPAAPERDRTLVVERIFNAPRERVFAAWTDPEMLVRWWGPEGHHIPESTIDVREGGAYRTVMESDTGDRHTVSGVFREIAPHERLVMTWGWEQPDGTRGSETLVEVTFEPAGDGTRLRLVQKVFETTEGRDNHGKGWASSLNCLEAFLAETTA